jgi:hypothetical protein
MLLMGWLAKARFDGHRVQVERSRNAAGVTPTACREVVRVIAVVNRSGLAASGRSSGSGATMSEADGTVRP